MSKAKIYSQDYLKECFNAWYLGGRPNTPHQIRKLLPSLPDGKVPSIPMINKIRINGAWDNWADELDAKVYEKNDKLLINKKATMLKKQMEATEKITLRALEHLIVEGFDSSSAAVQAFFKGHEEIRKIEGFSDLLEKLDKMTNNDVEREIIALLNRGADNDQIIESEVEDIEQEKENDTE